MAMRQSNHAQTVFRGRRNSVDDWDIRDTSTPNAKRYFKRLYRRNDRHAVNAKLRGIRS